MNHLWAPWRISYITNEKKTNEDGGCIFCAQAQSSEEDDPGNLIVYRGKSAYVVMNLFPYSPGHMMVVPYRHTSDLDSLHESEILEMQQLLKAAKGWLGKAFHPNGFNLGLNIGQAGGAGIIDHLHWHIVPRWKGDSNFMTTIADVRVIPQAMAETYRKLVAARG